MAAPAATGLFCNTLFNITDTFYAGWLATEAQAALAFAFPLYFILLSLSVAVLQAITAKVASATGAKNMSRARRLAGQGVLLGLTATVCIWLMVPFAESMLSLLGAKDKAQAWALEYISIIFFAAPVFIGAFGINGALHSLGNTSAFRDSIAAATVANILLDPALMFGWFGLPALGMKGIAWATVISQGGCAAYMLLSLSGTSLARGFKLRHFRPDRVLFPQMLMHGISPAGRMLCINAGFFIITGFLGYFSAAAVAGYGIALRLEQLFLLPTLGMEAAMLAYAGQNFGGRRPARVLAAYFLCLKKGFIVVAAGAAVMLLGGQFLTATFNSDAEVVHNGAQYLILAAASGPMYVIINVAGSVFLALGRHKIVLYTNILRLAIAPALFATILAIHLQMGIPGIWVGMLICNIVAAAYAHFRCLREIKSRRTANS